MGKKKDFTKPELMEVDEELLDKIEEAGDSNPYVYEEPVLPNFVKTDVDVALRSAPYLIQKCVVGKMARGKMYKVVGRANYNTIELFKLEDGNYVINSADLIKL